MPSLTSQFPTVRPPEPRHRIAKSRVLVGVRDLVKIQKSRSAGGLNCAPGQAACRLCWAQAYLSFHLVFHDRDWQKSKTLKASGRSPETPGVLFSISHRHGRTERSARKSQGFRPPGPAAPFPPLVVPVLRVDGGAVLGGVRRAPRARARAGHNGRARLCAHATGTGHAMRRRVIYSPSRR